MIVAAVGDAVAEEHSTFTLFERLDFLRVERRPDSESRTHKSQNYFFHRSRYIFLKQFSIIGRVVNSHTDP